MPSQLRIPAKDTPYQYDWVTTQYHSNDRLLPPVAPVVIEHRSFETGLLNYAPLRR